MRQREREGERERGADMGKWGGGGGRYKERVARKTRGGERLERERPDVGRGEIQRTNGERDRWR